MLIRYLLLIVIIGAVCSLHTTAQEHIFISSPINKQLQQFTVTAIGRDDSGFLWVATQFGLYRYDGVKAKVWTQTREVKQRSFRFGAIKHTPTGTLLASNETSIICLKGGKATTLPHSKDSVYLETLTYTWKLPARSLQQLGYRDWKMPVQAIMIFGRDTLMVKAQKGIVNITTGKQVLEAAAITPEAYYVQANGKAFRIDDRGVYEVSYSKQKLTHRLLRGLMGRKDFVTNTQNKLVFQWEKNLIELDQETGKIKYQIPTPEGDINRITCMYADPDAGRLFLGTPTRGVEEVQLFKGTVSMMSSAPENYCYTYQPLGMGKGFISALNTGIVWYGQNQQQYLYQGRVNQSFVQQDAAGRIWFETSDSILSVLDPQTRKIVWRKRMPSPIKALYFAPSHNAVIVTTSEVFSMMLPSGKCTSIFKSEPGVAVHCYLQKDRQHYLGTSNGLYHWFEGALPKQILERSEVRSLLCLGPNQIVIGTYGNGAYLMVNNQVKPFPVDEDGSINAVVNCSLDADSALWITCNRGAFIWTKKQWSNATKQIMPPAYQLETRIDLPVNELNGGQIPQVYYDNQIVLPSSRGLVIFNKKDIVRNQQVLSASLGELYLNGNPVRSGGMPQILPMQDNIHLELNAPYFGPLHNLATAYRVLGLDSTWRLIGQQRSFKFERLKPGVYKFELMTSQSGQPTTILTFRVLPYWHQRPIIWIFIILAIILIVYLAHFSRIRYLQRKQKYLEFLIAERTQELQLAVRTLEKSQNDLEKENQFREKLYTVLMHDLKSPLHFLSKYAVDQWFRFRSKEEVGKAFKTIADSSNDLSVFTTRFLTWMQQKKSSAGPKLASIDVVSLCRETTNLYQPLCALNDNQLFFFSLEQELFLKTDADLLRSVLRNLIDNANKYTKNGLIKVNCMTHQQEFKIEVTDTGRGFSEEIIQLLNSKSDIEISELVINGHYKLGIQICSLFIKQLNGRLQAENLNDGGAKVDIILPYVEYQKGLLS